MRTRLTLAIALTLAAGTAGAAPAVVLARVGARSATPIAVQSAAIGADRRFAARNTAFGADLSPEVNWSPVAGAHAWAVVLEDPDAPGARPFVHWLVWNIPAKVTRLAEGVTAAGALQGRNGRGGLGYWGPHPPSGAHRYYLQVFALDAPLSLAAGADRDALAAVLRGHVLASGEVVGVVTAPR